MMAYISNNITYDRYMYNILLFISYLALLFVYILSI